MGYVFDLDSQLKQIKADEFFLAFSGFTLSLAATETSPAQSVDGVLKVAGCTTQDKNGYLTLTFLVDAVCPAQQLQSIFDILTTEALVPLLGPSFEYHLPAITGTSEDAHWLMQEATFYFQNIAGRSHYLLEQRLIPALTQLLPITFEPIQWWDEENETPLAQENKESAFGKLGDFFKQKFSTS